MHIPLGNLELSNLVSTMIGVLFIYYLYLLFDLNFDYYTHRLFYAVVVEFMIVRQPPTTDLFLVLDWVFVSYFPRFLTFALKSLYFGILAILWP